MFAKDLHHVRIALMHPLVQWERSIASCLSRVPVVAAAHNSSRTMHVGIESKNNREHATRDLGHP